MSKQFRLFLVVCVILICTAFLFPTLKWYFLIDPDSRAKATSSKEQIKLYAKLVADQEINELRNLVSEDPETLMPEKFDYLVKKAKKNFKMEKKAAPDKWTIKEVLGSLRSQEKTYKAIEDYNRNLILDLKDSRNDILQLGLDLSGGMSVMLQADMVSLEDRLGKVPTAEDKKEAIDRAMEILNNRIDKFGVTEPQIRKQGDENIFIEIPGPADPERIRSFIMGKGRLAFHIVDDEATAKLNEYLANNPSGLNLQGQPKDKNLLDKGLVVRGFYSKDSYGIDQFERYLVIKQDHTLDGDHIEDARVGSDPFSGKPVINFTLDGEGGEKFFKLTSANVKKTLSIVLDDKIKAGASISEPIRESVRMSGFERAEAQNLALVLRTASLPVDLQIMNQQAVGASLGADSIKMGLNSIILGFILVIVFMFIYYKGAGLIADIALVLNLFIIIAVLSAFNLTLTMTSIAGIILTVGMAVDANVIIFERIKEEYAIGKSREASIKAGFRKAFWTVMDANITTFIAAIFLSQLGSGPIQGFAYTLAVGIVSSMFTALFVSRMIFDFGTEQLKLKRLSISWRIK